MNVIIPMAGRGVRFQKEYSTPKPLIDVNGTPMVVRAINSLGIPQCNYFFLIRKDEYQHEIEKVLKSTKPGCVIIAIDYTTEGPACSALLFEDYINNDEELIIANCDQIMEWNSFQFLHNARCEIYDGLVVTYYSDTDKNSYAKLDSNGYVCEVREKEVISNISLNGIHYWRKGKYFVESARDMIVAQDRAPNEEFYIAPSYNYMIKRGLKVGIHHIPNEQHHAVGVPVDLDRFLRYDKAKH
jgi:choline kinase